MLPAADHQSDLHPSGARCGAQPGVDGGPEPAGLRHKESLKKRRKKEKFYVFNQPVGRTVLALCTETEGGSP